MGKKKDVEMLVFLWRRKGTNRKTSTDICPMFRKKSFLIFSVSAVGTGQARLTKYLKSRQTVVEIE